MERLTLLLLLLLSGTSAHSHANSDHFRLQGQWEFHYGERPDDRREPTLTDWLPIPFPGVLGQQHGNPTTGWYRLRFDIPPTWLHNPAPLALLIEHLRLADETWLNGVRIGAEGSFDPPWHFRATNPQGMTRVYPIPAGLLRARNNVLTIKIAIGFGKAWGAMFPGGAGVIDGHIYIGNASALTQRQQKTLIDNTVLDTIFITLGIVDVLLIILLLGRSRTTFPEFKWLLLSSVLMLLGSAGHDLFYLSEWDIHANLMLMLALLGIPPSIALYFHEQYGHLTDHWLQSAGLLWLLASLLILLPGPADPVKTLAWYLYDLIAMASMLYALLCALRGVRDKRTAALPQLIALLVYIASIRTQWLPDAFLGHRNVQIGSLFYRYVLLYAYLARVRQIQIDYKALSRRVVSITDQVHASLSRELHDGIGQKLASIKLQAQLALGAPHGNHLSNIRHELDSAIETLHRMLAGLHPIQLDRRGLTTALAEETHTLRTLHPGVQINTRLDNVSLDKITELQLFRIFQESLNNAIRHGQATHITIDLEHRHQHLRLTIRDNGTGFDPDALQQQSPKDHGLGLISLNERVALLNGQVDIDSCPGQGSCITVTLRTLDAQPAMTEN